MLGFGPISTSPISVIQETIIATGRSQSVGGKRTKAQEERNRLLMRMLLKQHLEAEARVRDMQAALGAGRRLMLAENLRRMDETFKRIEIANTAIDAVLLAEL